ncbi:MAG TPA: hypothetical protein VH590_12035 [Ktedonobacterales bacterium]|jgi:hypothetical protein
MSAASLALNIPAPARARAVGRRKPRPPRPQKPADFFSAQAQALLTDLLASRAHLWRMDSEPPVYYYPRDSVPLWGDFARHRCSGTILRLARYGLLCESLCVDLERGLRLLTLPRTQRGQIADGHSAEEWHTALAGVLWRVGQLYRELARRKGDEQAREIVRLAMDTLWR